MEAEADCGLGSLLGDSSYFLSVETPCIVDFSTLGELLQSPFSGTSRKLVHSLSCRAPFLRVYSYKHLILS